MWERWCETGFYVGRSFGCVICLGAGLMRMEYEVNEFGTRGLIVLDIRFFADMTMIDRLFHCSFIMLKQVSSINF